MIRVLPGLLLVSWLWSFTMRPMGRGRKMGCSLRTSRAASCIVAGPPTMSMPIVRSVGSPKIAISERAASSSTSHSTTLRARITPFHHPQSLPKGLYPESSYSLSKVISEEMARQFNRTTGVPFVGFRISNIMEPPGDYEKFKSFQDAPGERRWNLWGYVDARDVAQACRLALETDITGAEVFILAAADTVMELPSH